MNREDCPLIPDYDNDWSYTQTKRTELLGFDVVIKYSTNDIINQIAINSVEFIDLSERLVKEIIASDDNYKSSMCEAIELMFDYEIREWDIYVHGHNDEVVL